MENARNTLFKITTVDWNEYYVVSESFDAAKDKLTAIFEKADYGCFANRGKMIVKIEVVAEEVYLVNNRPFLSSDGGKLILPDSCMIRNEEE